MLEILAVGRYCSLIGVKLYPGRVSGVRGFTLGIVTRPSIGLLQGHSDSPDEPFQGL